MLAFDITAVLFDFTRFKSFNIFSLITQFLLDYYLQTISFKLNSLINQSAKIIYFPKTV